MIVTRTKPIVQRCCAAVLAVGWIGLAVAGNAKAEDLQTYAVTLKGHRFSPAELHVPSGKPFFVMVTNGDDTSDEFEMSAPPVEKVIAPGEQGRLRIRPLAPGRFRFFDDFHPNTAQGAFVSE